MKEEIKLIGKTDAKIREETIKLMESSIDFEVKLLNDDSHIEEGIKKWIYKLSVKCELLPVLIPKFK